MPDIEVRIATSPAHRLAVLEVAHEATGSTAPPLVFQARRLHHHRRSRATWWLLEEDGAPAASLVCHPLRFSIDGEPVLGFGLGAVATRTDRRNRGHASALCSHVAEVCAGEGRPVGLLFSAIAPAFYERLGYRTTPAWNLRCENPEGFSASGPAAAIRALDPRAEAGALLALYRAHHAERHAALHLDRDGAAWERSLVENPQDLFFGWGDPLRGYVRLLDDEKELEVVELVAREPQDEAPVLRAAAAIARALGRPRLQGWFPPSSSTREWFQDAGRERTQPMVRGTEAAETAQFWGSDYF